MFEFLEKVVSEICKEEGIKHTNISKNFLTILEKDGKVRIINQFQMGVNSQISGFIATDKYAMYEVLKYGKIPVIDHVLVWDRYNVKNEKQIKEKINFLKTYFKQNNNHIVLKPNKGCGGEMLFNITEESQIKPAFETLIDYTKTIIACPFYKIKKEHRIIMLDGKCRLAFTKTLAKGEWRFNLSKGSTAKKLEEGALKNRLVDLAKKAYSYIGASFVSIDIIEDYEGKLYILEINSGVAMGNYTKQNPEDYELVKAIYKDVINKLFNEENRIELCNKSVGRKKMKYEYENNIKKF